MPLILNIDTAVQTASVCLAQGDEILETAISQSEREAATWLHTAIKALMDKRGQSLSELDAVAVSAGPGSYTGLRVGVAAAKGLCYALSLPLICINTLQMMAAAAEPGTASLLCPMIDARRMEVFAALYTPHLTEVMAATNLILTETSFAAQLQTGSICFFGNGSNKFAPLVRSENAVFTEVAATAATMVLLAAKKYAAAQFSDLAYTEPFYGKDFHSSIPKKIY